MVGVAVGVAVAVAVVVGVAVGVAVSKTIFEGPSIAVASYCGPAVRSTLTRMRVQVEVVASGGITNLSFAEVEELYAAIGRWLHNYGDNHDYSKDES